MRASRTALPSFSGRSPKPSRTTRRTRGTLLISPIYNTRLMMIRLTSDDAQGAVDLLEQDEARHPVREGHRRQRQPQIRPRDQRRRQAVGASDRERDRAAPVQHALAEVAREALGRPAL